MAKTTSVGGARIARGGSLQFLLLAMGHWAFATWAIAHVARAPKELNLTITNGRASPDGGSERQVVLINGELGGPTIVVDEAEELKVTVVNELDDPQYTEYGGY